MCHYAMQNLISTISTVLLLLRCTSLLVQVEVYPCNSRSACSFVVPHSKLKPYFFLIQIMQICVFSKKSFLIPAIPVLPKTLNSTGGLLIYEKLK